MNFFPDYDVVDSKDCFSATWTMLEGDGNPLGSTKSSWFSTSGDSFDLSVPWEHATYVLKI